MLNSKDLGVLEVLISHKSKDSSSFKLHFDGLTFDEATKCCDLLNDKFPDYLFTCTDSVYL